MQAITKVYFGLQPRKANHLTQITIKGGFHCENVCMVYTLISVALFSIHYTPCNKIKMMEPGKEFIKMKAKMGNTLLERYHLC